MFNKSLRHKFISCEFHLGSQDHMELKEDIEWRRNSPKLENELELTGSFETFREILARALDFPEEKQRTFKLILPRFNGQSDPSRHLGYKHPKEQI